MSSKTPGAIQVVNIQSANEKSILEKNIPIIDLDECSSESNPDGFNKLSEEIGRACRDWGFFQVVNHGIPDASLDETWLATKNFFCLPKSEKRKLNRSSDNPWGFFDHELTKNKRDKKEIFDIGPLHSDEGLSSEEPFLGKTPWPKLLPEFEQCMREHFKACEKLSLFILKAICLSLGVDKDHLTDCFFPKHTSFLRLNYYPVDDPLADLKEQDHGEAGLGVHHHTDSGALTILSQDNIGGLQVNKGGRWYPITPIDRAFVINIGDMVQVWSNGDYKAALHRVVAMDKEDRHSLPFFYNPTYSTNVNPLNSINSTRLYKEINWGEFRRKRADGDFANVGKEVQIDDYLIV